MKTTKEYRNRYYRAVDVKHKRNAKLKLNRREIKIPETCQAKGCSSHHHLILFTSYSKLTYLHLCQKHARRRIKRERTHPSLNGVRIWKAMDGEKWFDMGLADAQDGVLIDNHLLHPNYYKGYRVGFHGDEYDLDVLTWDHETIRLDRTANKYW